MAGEPAQLGLTFVVGKSNVYRNAIQHSTGKLFFANLRGAAAVVTLNAAWTGCMGLYVSKTGKTPLRSSESPGGKSIP